MTFNISEVNKLIRKKEFVESTLKKDLQKIVSLKRDIEDLEVCKDIFSSSLVLTRSEFVKSLKTLITPILRYIFDGRKFTFDLEEKNGSYVSVIKEGDKVYIPKYEVGGGLISILSIAFRIAFLELSTSRRVILVDELFSNLGVFTNRTMEAVRFLSKKLNIQFIIVTHDYSLLEFADKKFEVVYKNKRSKIKHYK